VADVDFPRQVVETIARRAGNHCSNPDCCVLTCGPAEVQDRAITIGEAAHIFGARAGAARFEEKMLDQERRDITNAIWLCRNCHKLVDSDAVQFPAATLFEWRRSHEQEIAKRLGKAGEVLRLKAVTRQLAEFASCSYLAQQIVLDRPPHWEYKLTVELLRSRLDPVLARWAALEKGLYAKAITIVSSDQAFDWFTVKLHEMLEVAAAFSALINGELQASWGPPGKPGNPKDILRTCDLFAENAERVVQWEENVRFTDLPSNFDELKDLLIGVGGRMLYQLDRIPSELGAIFALEHPSGIHRISLVIDLPDRWTERVNAALKRIANRSPSRKSWLRWT
jgi:hypothetical protein